MAFSVKLKINTHIAHILIGIPFVAIRNSFIALCLRGGNVRWGTGRVCGNIFRRTYFMIFMIVCRSKNIHAFDVCVLVPVQLQINGQPSQSTYVTLSKIYFYSNVPSDVFWSPVLAYATAKSHVCVCVCSDPLAAFRIDVDIGSSRCLLCFSSFN